MSTVVSGALIALSCGAAEAGSWRKCMGGLDCFSDSVWSNELGQGEPVVAFPRGCSGADCDFEIHVDFFPRSDPDCDPKQDEPPYPGCESKYNRCIAWIAFGDHILPLRSTTMHGSLETWKIEVLLDWRERGTLVDTSMFAVDIRGRRYQMLRIPAWELEVSSRDSICRLGIEAIYHQNSKTVFEKGYLLPR